MNTALDSFLSQRDGVEQFYAGLRVETTISALQPEESGVDFVRIWIGRPHSSRQGMTTEIQRATRALSPSIVAPLRYVRS